MSKVVLDMSMSLDGIGAGPNPRAEEPMGTGGERLHAWHPFHDPAQEPTAGVPATREAEARMVQELFAATGAVVLGKRTFELGLEPWGVLQYGLIQHVPMSYGLMSIVVSFVVLLLWIPLRQWPGLGTVLNAVVIGLAVAKVVAWPWVAVPAGLLVAWLVACRVSVRAERGLRTPRSAIEIGLPPQVEETGDLWLRAGHGSATVGTADGTVEIIADHGQITVGRISGTALLKASHGSVHVQEAGGDLEAKLSYGDLEIGRALGSVTAKTAYGDIALHEVSSGSVEAESGYGEVSVVVAGHITKLNARAGTALPDGTPVTITAVLSATSVQVAPRG